MKHKRPVSRIDETGRFYLLGAAARETKIAVAGEGRYVRVQLAGQNWLSLAEVEVIGTE